jgi:hypothetical protein
VRRSWSATVGAFLAARREAARAIEARLRDEIGTDGVAQLLRFLDAVAGGDAAGESDLPWDTPALRALRWWDAEERP